MAPDVEPIPLDQKVDGKSSIDLHLEAPSPLRSFSSSTSSTTGPPSGLGGSQVSDAAEITTPTSDQSDAVKSPSGFKLSSACIDDDRPMKVVVIGAGFSGIIAGIRFPQRMKNIDLTIYDKNAGVGGTWYSNKYPGLACDIPSHCYQLTFEENTNWSAHYAPGPEIRAYLERVVDKFKLMRYIKLQHELTHAQYDEDSGKWHLKLRRPVSGELQGEGQYEIIDDSADFVLSGSGGLSRWKWPSIPGLEKFKGKLLHSASWEIDDGKDWKEGVKDWSDKKVGVVGVGSSAIQIVPALRPFVRHVYNYVRGKTWLAPPFASTKLSELMKRDSNTTNYKFSDEDRKQFQDSAYYKAFRHELEVELNAAHFATVKGSEMQKAARAAFKENMIKKLEKRPWIANHSKPWVTLLINNQIIHKNGHLPRYLEALCEDNVSFVPTHIKAITETGIELVDGTHHDLDVLVCATGFDTSYQFPFSVVGRGGRTLNERFAPHPETYLAVCTDGFPNWFMSLGPNSGIGTGSLLIIIERQIDYAIAAAKKMQREHLKSIEAKKEAVKDFDEYLEHYFQTSIYSEKCRSWYKMGLEEGRVVGLWPGSCLHAVHALKHPRWEDYDYEPLGGSENRNRFHWLGDGSTYNEKHMVGDRAWYLNAEEVDIPPVPKQIRKG